MTAVYLYCIVKRGRRPASSKTPAGLPGASPAEAVNVSGSLWLVVAEVPLDVYGPGRLDRHLADLDWVGRVALAHEAVVEHFTHAAGTTVIPMKLFTMFSTRARAVADIAARRKTIEASLRRIAGAEEWGIRVLRGEPVEKPPSNPVRRTGSGAEFLAAKKQARDAAKSSRQAAAGAALQAYERLSKVSKDSRRRHDPPAAGAPPPLLDAAFLVASTKRTKFTAVARREAAACAAAGARMTLSGPWPAYNFVQPDDWSR